MPYPEDNTFSMQQEMEWDWLPEGEGMAQSAEDLYEVEYAALHMRNSTSSGAPEYMVQLVEAETGRVEGTIYLDHLYNLVGASNSVLVEEWRKFKETLGWGSMPGDLYGRRAVEDYARCNINEQNSSLKRGACWFAGVTAAAWTPETSVITTGVLGIAYSATGWAARTGPTIDRQSNNIIRYLDKKKQWGYRIDKPHGHKAKIHTHYWRW